MQFIVSQRHIKQFSKSLQCISRIGDDLYIECRRDGVKFITVNNSKSTYVVFQFHETFFNPYTLEGEEGVQYKTKSKLCFQMFHSLNNIDKCAMKIEPEGKITFFLLCKNGIQKVYSINYELAPCQSALYNKDSPYKITVKPKQISECLNYFSGSTDEISITVQKDRMLIKSSTDDKKSLKVLQTELILDRCDFDDYVFNGDGAEISFSFKDLKTIMAYVDVIGNPCSYFIERSGQPFHINVKYSTTFEVDFVLATLFDANSQTSQPSSQQTYQAQREQELLHQQFQAAQAQQQQQYNQAYRNNSNNNNNNNNVVIGSSPVSMNVRSVNNTPSNVQQPQSIRNISTVGIPNTHYLQQQQYQQQQYQQQYNSPDDGYVYGDGDGDGIPLQHDDDDEYLGPMDHDLSHTFTINRNSVASHTTNISNVMMNRSQQQQQQPQTSVFQSSNGSASHKRPLVSFRPGINLEEDDDDEEEEEFDDQQNDEPQIQTSQHHLHQQLTFQQQQQNNNQQQ